MNPLSLPPKLSKFGNPPIFNQVITGIQTGVGVLSQLGGGHGHTPACHAPSGCFQCKMTGRGDIAGCIDALFAQLHQIHAQGDNRASLTASQNALAALSNAAYFQQGDSYLSQAIADCQHDITYFSGLIASGNLGTTATGNTTINAQGQTVNTATGQVVAASIIAGVPNGYLIGGAAAVLGLVYFLRK